MAEQRKSLAQHFVGQVFHYNFFRMRRDAPYRLIDGPERRSFNSIEQRPYLALPPLL